LFVKNEDIHWVRPDRSLHPGEAKIFKARIRYRQALQGATLYRESHGLYVVFDDAQRGITPGQFVAWYDGEELIGSGVID
jgi:tRNA-specific 2-thiouridylase